MNPFLLPFSAGFRAGTALRQSAYRHGWWKVQRLSRPVVSVGNLTVGGTGKTPLVARVARILLAAGWHPCILTRGYGRVSRSDLLAIPAGEGRDVNPAEAGDEPALLARALPEVPLVICPDRFRGGKLAEERFAVDTHILDDGFQHLALARDLDLVALDTTQALSDWNLLPAGRQREPLSALRRAQMVVLTRTDSADPRALTELVQNVHPAAQIFRSRTRLLGWTSVPCGAKVSAEGIRAKPVAAFCGIGNPQAFFGDLRRWGFQLVGRDAFPDHHVYTGEELNRLVETASRQGASALLTTQKDAVKLPATWAPAVPVLACEIEAEILDARFEATLLRYLPKAS